MYVALPIRRPRTEVSCVPRIAPPHRPSSATQHASLYRLPRCNSSVTVVTSVQVARAGYRGWIFGRNWYSVFHRVRTGSGADRASCSVSRDSNSLSFQWRRRGVTQAFPSTLRLASIVRRPIRLCVVVTNWGQEQLQHWLYLDFSILLTKSVIQNDGLNFVHLYFLNYTWYVNVLHNV